MDKALIEELEKYREAAMNYWHIVGDDENAEDMGTRSYEKLLLETAIMARIKMQHDAKEYENYLRRYKNEQN